MHLEAPVKSRHNVSACPQHVQAQELPPDLREIVRAWPKLPQAIRAGILAMVKAYSSE